MVSFQLEPHLRKTVLQIYIDLTRTDLMSRCLKGKTQNPNESFHSKIWNKLSKSKFVSLPTAEYSIANAVLRHNNGSERSNIFHINLPTAITFMQNSDKERTRKSLTPANKKKRTRDVDDSADYAAGLF